MDRNKYYDIETCQNVGSACDFNIEQANIDELLEYYSAIDLKLSNFERKLRFAKIKDLTKGNNQGKGVYFSPTKNYKFKTEGT